MTSTGGMTWLLKRARERTRRVKTLPANPDVLAHFVENVEKKNAKPTFLYIPFRLVFEF